MTLADDFTYLCKNLHGAGMNKSNIETERLGPENFLMQISAGKIFTKAGESFHENNEYNIIEHNENSLFFGIEKTIYNHLNTIIFSASSLSGATTGIWNNEKHPSANALSFIFSCKKL